MFCLKRLLWVVSITVVKGYKGQQNGSKIRKSFLVSHQWIVSYQCIMARKTALKWENRPLYPRPLYPTTTVVCSYGAFLGDTNVNGEFLGDNKKLMFFSAHTIEQIRYVRNSYFYNGKI
mgnify:CR=1 FL=1